MTDDLLFITANAVVAPVWLLMIALPGWRVTRRVASSLVASVVVALIYLGVVLASLGGSDSGGGFFSLDDVALLFTDRDAVLAGWIHYLCFDLVVGAWVFRDARRLGLSHIWVAPSLFLTLMWGPIGLLLYLIVRTARTRDWQPMT